MSRNVEKKKQHRASKILKRDKLTLLTQRQLPEGVLKSCKNHRKATVMTSWV